MRNELKHGNLARENVGRHLQRAILTVVFTSGRSREKSAPAVTYYVPLLRRGETVTVFSGDYNGKFIHARGILSATVMVSFLRKRHEKDSRSEKACRAFPLEKVTCEKLTGDCCTNQARFYYSLWIFRDFRATIRSSENRACIR